MKTFLISDTHFGHANVLTFTKEDGTRLRPYWDTIEDHDEDLIQRWNNTVGVNDKVYHLGDVGFRNYTSLASILNRLNGTKVLIKGNHDNFKLDQYANHFKDIRAYHVLDKFVLSHIPVHPESVSRWKGNIHGHLHANIVEKSPHHPDKRYLNVSVEQISYTPIDFEELRAIFKEREPTR